MGVWPDDPLIGSAPPEARLARRISILLRDYVDDRGFNPREADAATGISEKTIRNLLDGTVWPHMAMIARLENKLGIPLWVGQHNDGHGTKLELAPRDYLDAGKWPTGPLIEDAPPEAVLAKESARRSRTHTAAFATSTPPSPNSKSHEASSRVSSTVPHG